MISDLIVLGLFSLAPYDTPAARTIILPATHRPLKLPAKLVGETHDYCLDWTARLSSDVIIAVAVDVPSGVVVASKAIFNASTTSFWLAGGRPGNGAIVRAIATTAGGRTFEELLPIRCL